MSYGLFLPRRWTRQPQGPVEIDRGSSLSDRCLIGWTPYGRSMLARGPIRSTPHGAGAYSPTDNAYQIERNSKIQNADAVWAAAIVHITQPLTGSYFRIVGTRGAPEGSGDRRGWEIAIDGGSITEALIQRFASNGDRTQGLFALGSSAFATGSLACMVFHVSRDASNTYVSGFASVNRGAELSGSTSIVGAYGDDTAGLNAIEVAGKQAGSTTDNPGAVLGMFMGVGSVSAAWRREWFENPWQLIRPRRPIIYSLGSAGAVHELAGDATAGASAAGSLTTAIQLDGDASAGATASGDLATGIPLAGDAAAAAQASGTLSTEIRLAAAALVSATATGSLSTAINLAGSAAFAALADGTLTTQIRLAGAAIAGAVADAGLSTQILLDADAQAGADASGELTTVPSGLAGDAVAGATASGALSVQIILAGDALAAVLASGDLTTLGAGAELAGAATVLAIASGGLTTAIQLTGAPVISVTASGELSIGLGMTADALATVSASAVLSTQIRMEGAAVASALAAGSLSIGTAEHGARRASWRGAARQGWTRPASVQRASRPRQYG